MKRILYVRPNAGSHRLPLVEALAPKRDDRFKSAIALQSALESLAVANRFPLSSLRVSSFLGNLFESSADKTPATTVLRNAGKTRVRVMRPRRRAPQFGARAGSIWRALGIRNP